MGRGDLWRGAGGTPVSAVGEFALIDRLRALVERSRGGVSATSGGRTFVSLGIGDDAAAVLPSAGHEILVTCDAMVEGRHFSRAWTPPRKLGRRSVAINASDIGAMGGLPRAAVVSLGIPPQTSVEDIEEIYRGMLERLDELAAVLIGGNVTSVPSGLIIDLTMIGEVEEGRAVRRNGSKPGDLIWVTGMPGAAAAGLGLLRAGVDPAHSGGLASLVDAYLDPPSRAREGRALGVSGAVTAMIDVSDGLFGDLHHMVEGGRLDIVIQREALPVGEELNAAGSTLGLPPESFLMGASDDYELLFAAAPDSAEAAIQALRKSSDVSVWPIGEVVGGGAGRVLIEESPGSRTVVPPRGWDHFSPAP